MKVDIELIQRGGVAPLIFSNVHRSDHRCSSEELSSAKERNNFWLPYRSFARIPISIRKSRKTGARTVSRIHFFSVLTSKVKSKSNFRLRYFSASKFKIFPRDSAGQIVCATKLVGSVQGTVRSPSLAVFSQYLPSNTTSSRYVRGWEIESHFRVPHELTIWPRSGRFFPDLL